VDIYTGQVNCERWLVDRPFGWNAGLTDSGPMCGGGGEVQVMSVETHCQPDAGWLAAANSFFILVFQVEGKEEDII